ncbi:MAG: hypothetical protein H6492_02055 [Candidatus Paracaedibacteraceae bacterium]|nr:hypothetical protein [Candidatus Paracaedibacteraceae bacterium]
MRSKLLIQSALCGCFPLAVFTTHAEIAHSTTIDHYQDYLTTIQAETISQGPRKQKENERAHIASEVKKTFPNISDSTMHIILSGICAHVDGMNHIEEHLDSEDHNDPHEILHSFLDKLKAWLKDSPGMPHEQYIMKSKITPLYPNWLVERNTDGTFLTGTSSVEKFILTVSPPIEIIYGSAAKVIINASTESSGTIQITPADGKTESDSYTAKLNDSDWISTSSESSFNNGENTFTLQQLSAGDYIIDVTANELTASTFITIKPKELSVSGLTVGDKEYDGTTTAAVSGGAILNGIAYDDDVILDVAKVTATFGSKDAGTQDVFISGLVLTGDTASNYTLPAISSAATIKPRSLRINGITVEDRTYDKGTSAVINGTPTLDGIIAGEEEYVTLAGTPIARFNSANAGSNKTVLVFGYTLEGTAAENYTLDSTLTGTILSRTVTATITIDDKVYDGETDAVIRAVTLDGVLEGDEVKFEGDAHFAGSTAGTHQVIIDPVNLSGQQASNYTLAPIDTITATITAAVPTENDIVVNLNNQNPAEINLGDSFTVTGTVTGLTPGVLITLPIIYTVTANGFQVLTRTIFVEVEGDEDGNANFSFNIASQDMMEADPSGQYNIDVSITEAAEGEQGYSEHYNYDPATGTYEVSVENIAPAPQQNIEVLAGDAVMYGANSTVTITSPTTLDDVALEIRDAQNNVVGYEFSINNGANWLGAGVLSLTAGIPTEILIRGLDAGTYTVHVTEGDATGNAELTVNPIPVQVAFVPPLNPGPITVLVGDGANNPIDITFDINYDVLFGNYPDGYEGNDPLVLQAQLIAEDVTTEDGQATFNIGYDFGGAEPGVYTIFITSASNTNYVFDIIEEAQAFMFNIGEGAGGVGGAGGDIEPGDDD